MISQDSGNIIESIRTVSPNPVNQTNREYESDQHNPLIDSIYECISNLRWD